MLVLEIVDVVALLVVDQIPICKNIDFITSTLGILKTLVICKVQNAVLHLEIDSYRIECWLYKYHGKNVIEFMDCSSTGNTTDFGDLLT